MKYIPRVQTGGTGASARRQLELGSAPSLLPVRVRRIEDRASARPPGDAFVLMLIDGGGGWHVAGTSEHRTSTGDLYVITPDETHDDGRLGTTRGWIVEFRPDAVGPPSAFEAARPEPGDPRWLCAVRRAQPSALRYVVPSSDRPRWERRLHQLADELERERPAYQRAARALLELLLVDTARLALPALGDRPQSVAHAIPGLVDEVFEVIAARYGEQLSLREVAAAVGRSPGHVGRTVREATGRTVMQWIEDRRMLEARRLLLATDDKVDGVAERVGYRDPSYFRRRFRRAHGVPPQAWRERTR
jgi:AraC family transcriptional regulator, transcriptional activator of pobA